MRLSGVARFCYKRTMSTISTTAHLNAGCEDPPRVQGLLRLYSMKFCPYAQRPRLVLKAKRIPHEIVNIDLSDRPDWYYKIHPEGKVPALLDQSKCIIESLDICEYIEEKYPQNPLYPSEPEAKRRDKELIDMIDPVIEVFVRCLMTDGGTPGEWLSEFLEPLQVFEVELARRGTIFFGGNIPGMVDYMLWPWAERAGVIAMKLGRNLPVTEDHITCLRRWRRNMRKQPVCDEISASTEMFWKVVQNKIKGLNQSDKENQPDDKIKSNL